MSRESVTNINNHLADLWESTETALATYAAQRHIPLGGTFELTPRCNFSCKMCYVRLSKAVMDTIGRERTAKEWISLAREAISEGTLNLLITGGEPLLREDFGEIYEAVSKMGFIISINTNAALMNPELLKLFKHYPPTALNVTLYGASPETYGNICGNPEGFKQTLEGLEMLSEVSSVLEIRTTFIRDNKTELEAVRKIANRYTSRFAINTNVNKPVRGADTDVESCRLTPVEMFDLSDANKQYYRNVNGPREMAAEKNMDTDHPIDLKDYGYDLPPKIISCLAAKSMYWITWDGKMIPCGSFTSPYTQPFVEGFKNAWNRLPELFESVSLPKECTKCEYSDGRCSNCPAVLQAETGCLDKISGYICEIARERARRRQV